MHPSVVSAQFVPRFLYIGIPTTVLLLVSMIKDLLLEFGYRNLHDTSCDIAHHGHKGQCRCGVYLIAVDDVHI